MKKYNVTLSFTTPQDSYTQVTYGLDEQQVEKEKTSLVDMMTDASVSRAFRRNHVWVFNNCNGSFDNKAVYLTADQIRRTDFTITVTEVDN